MRKKNSRFSEEDRISLLRAYSIGREFFPNWEKVFW